MRAGPFLPTARLSMLQAFRETNRQADLPCSCGNAPSTQRLRASTQIYPVAGAGSQVRPWLTPFMQAAGDCQSAYPPAASATLSVHDKAAGCARGQGIVQLPARDAILVRAYACRDGVADRPSCFQHADAKLCLCRARQRRLAHTGRRAPGRSASKSPIFMLECRRRCLSRL